MTALVESLAQAMFEVENPGFDWAKAGGIGEVYRGRATFVLHHFNIPEDAESVDVGKAVAALLEEPCECEVSARPCGRCMALVYLGVKDAPDAHAGGPSHDALGVEVKESA